jgi:hypothetical protein
MNEQVFLPQIVRFGRPQLKKLGKVVDDGEDDQRQDVAEKGALNMVH